MLFQNDEDKIQQYWDLQSKDNLTSSITDLESYMRKAGFAKSNKTIEGRIGSFKTLMDWIKNDTRNPYLAYRDHNDTSLPYEIKCVHFKVYHYLTEQKYMTLNSTYNGLYMKLCIPTYLLPVLASYIYALGSPQNSPENVTELFNRMKEVLTQKRIDTFCTQYPQYNKELLSEHLEYWIDTVLGKSYYCLLQQNIDQLATNIAEKNDLYTFTNTLTQTHMYCISSKLYGANLQLTKLLQLYFDKITTLDTNSSQKIFTYAADYKIKGESKYVESLLKNLKNNLEIVYASIALYIQLNSTNNETYPLEIKNFSHFDNIYQKLYLMLKRHNLSLQIIGWYNQYINSNEFRESINNKEIEFVQDAFAKRQESLIHIFEDAYEQSRKSCADLFNGIKGVSTSDSNIRREDFINVTHKSLHQSFSNIMIKTKKKLESSFYSLPSMIKKRTEGTAETYKYPEFPYSINELSIITQSLMPNTSPEELKQLLLDNLSSGIAIPCGPSDLCQFLEILYQNSNNIKKPSSE